MNEYDFSDGRRGPVVQAQAETTRITIRLDEDVVRWFKDEVDRAGGGSYQDLINAALGKHIVRHVALRELRIGVEVELPDRALRLLAKLGCEAAPSIARAAADRSRAED